MKTDGDCLNSETECVSFFSVIGLIVPVQYDENFRVLSIKVLTTDEKEYLIEDNAAGKALLRYQKKFVKLSCVASREHKGIQSIFVKDFIVVESL